jgi:hypothetical protein
MTEKKKAKEKSYHLYVSLNSIKVGDWTVKASSMGSRGILLILFNEKTIESITRYFTNEIEAASFMSDLGARASNRA